MGYAKSCRTEQNVQKKPGLNQADDSDRKQDHLRLKSPHLAAFLFQIYFQQKVNGIMWRK